MSESENAPATPNPYPYVIHADINADCFLEVARKCAIQMVEHLRVPPGKC